MASIIKKLNKQTGITYVYESESYWDKDKKQPRSKRKLIGKIDEETGEIVPTGTRGKPGERDKMSDKVSSMTCFFNAESWASSCWSSPACFMQRASSSLASGI